jgi:hypothetical protein
MTSKAEALRKQRAAMLADRKAQRDAFIKSREAAEDKFAKAKAALDKAQAHLDDRCRRIDADVAHLDKQIAASEAVEKIEQLRTAAAALDRDGHSPERLRVFERLCTELAAPLVGRFMLRTHEHRQNVFRRMKREADVTQFRPPYPTWSALVDACVRAPPEHAA